MEMNETNYILEYTGFYISLRTSENNPFSILTEHTYAEFGMASRQKKTILIYG